MILYTGIYIGYLAPKNTESLIFPISINFITSITGIVLCFYWRSELREILLIEQTLSQILLESELKLMKYEFENENEMEELLVYKNLWERLGNIKFKRYPSLLSFSNLSLPFTFILIHFFEFFLNFLIFLEFMRDVL